MSTKRKSTALEEVTQSAEALGEDTEETSSPSKRRAKTSKPFQPFSQLSSEDFSSSKIALFDGPRVAVTVVGKTSRKTYQLPKSLLVDASPYFAAAFEGQSIEGIEQKIELHCPTTAFDLVVQYLYTGTFNTSTSLTPPQEISALLNFCVLLDMLLIQDSSKAVGRIKELLLEPAGHLKKEHIRQAATELPTGHAARKLFADATIQQFIGDIHSKNGNPNFEFRQEVADLDGYAADLARAYREVAKTTYAGRIFYKDQFRGTSFCV